MEKEKRTAFLELLRDFGGTEKAAEKRDKENSDKKLKEYMEEKGFDREYSESQKIVESLESMLNHPDIKVRKQERGKGRKIQTTQKTKSQEYNIEARNQEDKEEDRELDR